MLKQYRVVFPHPPKRDPALIAIFPWANSPAQAVQFARRVVGMLPPGTFAREVKSGYASEADENRFSAKREYALIWGSA